MLSLSKESQAMTDSAARVFKNMYNLVSLSLIMSLIMGVVSHYSGIGTAILSNGIGLVFSIVGLFGLIYAIHKFANSSFGVGLMFGFAGFMGFFMEPMVSKYLSVNPAAVAGAGVMTLAITFSMGMWGMVTKRDLSGLGKVLFFSLIGVIVGSIFNLFFGSSILETVISIVAVVVFSLYIMKDTNDVVRGFQTNYVIASVGMYLNIANLFMNLLSIMGSSDD